jgi:hypothetical protein
MGNHVSPDAALLCRRAMAAQRGGLGSLERKIMNVWLVYDDGEVMGVFSNEVAAKQFAEANDWTDIEGPVIVRDKYEPKPFDYDAPNLGEE